MFKVKKSKGNIRRKNTGRIEEEEAEEEQEEEVVEVINGLNENIRDSTITRRPIINLQQQQQRNPLVLSKQKNNTGITRPIEDYVLKQTAEEEEEEDDDDEPINIINPTTTEEKESMDIEEADEEEDEDLVGEDYNNKTKNISFGLNAVKELKLKQERIKTEQLKEGLSHINNFDEVEDEEFLKLEHDVIRRAIGNNNNNKYSFPLLFDGVNYEESKQKTKLLLQLNNNNIQESVNPFDEYMNNLQEELDLMNSEIKRQEELLEEINYELE
ncbi:hypothetical protein MP638_004328 [Amoeboaphelidium occidentale]|nr:hypothetical protein MP638_004328 [Amoeboaphelidium occidentale]